MTITQQIKYRINNIPEGVIFTYNTLGTVNSTKQTATKAIQRLIESNQIARISKGKFYKPEKSVFGATRPNAKELLKTYLFKKGKRVAYETGNSLYNRLGLTSQVSKYITLGVFESRVSVDINNLKIKSIKSYLKPTDSNIKYLQYLDIIKDFKTIPDMDINYTIEYLSKELKKLDPLKLIKYALKYPPRVLALVGATMENSNIDTGKIKQNLNPLSKYDYGISLSLLPTANNWNIR